MNPPLPTDIFVAQNLDTVLVGRLLNEASPGLTYTCLKGFDGLLEWVVPDRRQIFFIANSFTLSAASMARLIRSKNPRALIFVLTGIVPASVDLPAFDGMILKIGTDYKKPFRIVAEMILAFQQELPDSDIIKITF